MFNISIDCYTKKACTIGNVSCSITGFIQFHSCSFFSFRIFFSHVFYTKKHVLSLSRFFFILCKCTFVLKHVNTENPCCRNRFENNDAARSTFQRVQVQNDINLTHLETKFPFNKTVKNRQLNFLLILHILRYSSKPIE
jgi:hypothetical protein